MTPETCKALLWNSRIRLRQMLARINVFEFLEIRDLSEVAKTEVRTVQGTEVLTSRYKLDVIHKQSWHEFEKWLLYGDTKHRFSPIVDTQVNKIGKTFLTRIAPNSALYVVRDSTGEASLVFCHKFGKPTGCDPAALWQELASELPIQGFPVRTKF